MIDTVEKQTYQLQNTNFQLLGDIQGLLLSPVVAVRHLLAFANFILQLVDLVVLRRALRK